MCLCVTPLDPNPCAVPPRCSIYPVTVTSLRCAHYSDYFHVFAAYFHVFLIVLFSEVGGDGVVFVFLQIGKPSAPQSQRGSDHPQPRPPLCHQHPSKHPSALARFQVSDFISVNQNFANVKCFVVLTKYDKYGEHSLRRDFFFFFLHQ